MKRTLKILVILVTSLSLLTIGNLTYSKYRNAIVGTTDMDISVWNIKVNTEEINGKQVLTNDITPTFDSDSNVRTGVLAPGVTGYYDIVIDSTDVDVSFSYSLTCVNSTESTIDDLTVTGYQINPSTSPPIEDYVTDITGNIILNEDTLTIRIFIEWDDSITATMDNAADTAAVVDPNAKALITNSIQFTQIQ